MRLRQTAMGACLLLLLACHQAGPAPSGDDVAQGADVVPGETSAPRQEPISCRDNPLATPLYTLVNRSGHPIDGCGQFDPRMSAAFDRLLAEAGQRQVPNLRQRLLSGPAAPGRPLQVADTRWWLHGACQAHQCDSTRLATLYEPRSGRMVGRLLTQCQVLWLGDPEAPLRQLLDAESAANREELQDNADCPDNAADTAQPGAWRKVSDATLQHDYVFSMLPSPAAVGSRWAAYDMKAGTLVCCMIVKGDGIPEARLRGSYDIPGPWVTDLTNGWNMDGAPYRPHVQPLQLDGAMRSHVFMDDFGAAGGLLLPATGKALAAGRIELDGQPYTIERKDVVLGDDDGGVQVYTLHPLHQGPVLTVEVPFATY